MATTLTSECNLLAVPFSAATDFTDLAEYCDRVATTLIECRDLALKTALCGRLNTCLALLRPTLNEPIPPHLIDGFITNDIFPMFHPVLSLMQDHSAITAWR